MPESRTSNNTRAAVGGVAVTTNVEFPGCVALLVSEDVAATVTFADGSAVAGVPLQKGYNPIQATKVVFASGTIVALYNA